MRNYRYIIWLCIVSMILGAVGASQLVADTPPVPRPVQEKPTPELRPYVDDTMNTQADEDPTVETPASLSEAPESVTAPECAPTETVIEYVQPCRRSFGTLDPYEGLPSYERSHPDPNIHIWEPWAQR